ncbi:MAG: glycosyltransferase [Saprospiraceae bacterium]
MTKANSTIESKETDISDLSLVICYNNEEQNIAKCLPSIINQSINDIVLIDDNSTDNTYQILKENINPSISVFKNTTSSKGKKDALNLGVKKAKNNKILLTDADCIPASDQWATTMNKSGKNFVLGYAPMTKSKNLIGVFSQYETYLTAIQYLSYAKAGIPYMGVGRNMLVDKKIINQGVALIKGEKLMSGDDDLMINALSNKNNTTICIDPKTFVYSTPKTTFIDFIAQKARHMTTSVYYQPLHQILLGTFSFSQIMFYLIGMIGLMMGTISVSFFIIAIAIKWGVQQIINFSIMKKLNESDLFWKFPLLDIFLAIYYTIMPFYILFRKNKNTWN